MRKSKAEVLGWPKNHRQCNRCMEVLPFDRFGKNSNKWGGVESVCKLCRKPISKEYYDRWVEHNPEQRLLSAAKTRAKKQGLPFDLDIDDIVIPEYCPVLGIKLDRLGGKWKDGTPSLDKIVAELGYVKGNVAVISWKANWLKRDGSLEDFKSIVNYIERNTI